MGVGKSRLWSQEGLFSWLAVSCILIVYLRGRQNQLKISCPGTNRLVIDALIYECGLDIIQLTEPPECIVWCLAGKCLKSQGYKNSKTKETWEKEWARSQQSRRMLFSTMWVRREFSDEICIQKSSRASWGGQAHQAGRRSFQSPNEPKQTQGPTTKMGQRQLLHQAPVMGFYGFKSKYQQT